MLDGETSRLINDAEAGLTCDSDDPDQLAINLLKMSMMDKQEIARMGNNAFNLYMEKFNREKLFNEVEQLFFNTIKK